MSIRVDFEPERRRNANDREENGRDGDGGANEWKES
jgi:hypothetical protein